MIHDVITTAKQFPCTAKLKFIGVKNNKLNKSDIEKFTEQVHSVVVYQKYLTRLGEMILFLPRLENHQFLQPH